MSKNWDWGLGLIPNPNLPFLKNIIIFLNIYNINKSYF